MTFPGPSRVQSPQHLTAQDEANRLMSRVLTHLPRTPTMDEDDQHDGGLMTRLVRETLAETRLTLVRKGETISAVYDHAPNFREDLDIVLNTLQGLRAYDPR